MTFSFNVKDEVTRLETSKMECIAELSAIIRNSAIISDNIEISIENNAVARRIYKLIKGLYDVIPVIGVRRKYFSNIRYTRRNVDCLKFSIKFKFWSKDIEIVIILL